MHARRDKGKKNVREEKNSYVADAVNCVDTLYTESNLKAGRSLEEELRKVYYENKKLKKMMKEEKLNEMMVEEMMNSFRARLYKFLYD